MWKPGPAENPSLHIACALAPWNESQDPLADVERRLHGVVAQISKNAISGRGVVFGGQIGGVLLDEHRN